MQKPPISARAVSRRQLLRNALVLGGASAGVGLLGQANAQSEPDEPNEPADPNKPGIEGFMAPELEVGYWIDADGKPASFSMKESANKWVLLKCFQNWCPGCHKSGFPTLKAFSDRFHDHPKVAIAGIQTVFEGYSRNTQDAVRELQLRYELPIVMGHDPGNPETGTYSSTMVNYRTGGTPWLILVNPDGAVVFNGFHVNTDRLIEFAEEQVA